MATKAKGPRPMPKDAGPQAPAHLEAATRDWWLNVVRTWELDEHHVRLLTLAAEAFDRGVQARQILDRRGLTFKDRFGQPKPRPEVAIERDSRVSFARLLRELDLDVEPPTEGRRIPLLQRMR
jgi:phage terminase small subunit